MLIPTPKDWKTKPLGELLSVQNGYAFASDQFSKNGGMPLIRIRDLKGGRDTDVRFEGEFDKKFVVRAGDLLIGMDGEFRCYKWQGSDALLNQRVCRLVDFDNEVLPEFVYYGINPHLKVIEDNTPFVTVRHLSAKKVNAIDFAYPSLNEQRRIVARIKECMERAEEIEALRTESYHECSMVLRAYYHDLYRGLVQRYTTMPLADAGIAMGGGTPSRKRDDFWNGDIPWVSPKEMKRRDLLNATQNITEVAIEDSSTKLITEPSVLFVVRGMILSHTLPVAVNRIPLTINQDMKAITPRGNINVDFLAAMLRGSERELLSKVEVAGHGTRRLQTAHWRTLPVPKISEQDQAAIVSEVQNMEAVADALIRDVEFDEIRLLRGSILSKAFSGEF